MTEEIQTLSDKLLVPRIHKEKNLKLESQIIQLKEVSRRFLNFKTWWYMV